MKSKAAKSKPKKLLRRICNLLFKAWFVVAVVLVVL
jgi:hypothetical protein